MATYIEHENVMPSLAPGDIYAAHAFLHAWAMTAEESPRISCAGPLAPGDAIHTHPLHPHRGAPMPSVPQPLNLGRCAKRKLEASPLGEDELRRIIFCTYGRHVSAEETPYFSLEEFMRASQKV